MGADVSVEVGGWVGADVSADVGARVGVTVSVDGGWDGGGVSVGMGSWAVPTTRRTTAKITNKTLKLDFIRAPVKLLPLIRQHKSKLYDRFYVSDRTSTYYRILKPALIHIQSLYTKLPIALERFGN